MIRMTALAAMAAFTLATAGFGADAQAQPVGTARHATSNVGLQDFAGQVVSVPGPGVVLQSYTLTIEYIFGAFSVRPEIYEVTSIAGSSVNVVPTPVYSGDVISVPGPGAAEFTFTPRAVVDPAKRYVIGVRRVGAGFGGVYFADVSDYMPGQAVGGSGAVLTSEGRDFGFTAVFAPPAAAVPTLGEWAMIVFGTALAGSALLNLGRRRIV